MPTIARITRAKCDLCGFDGEQGFYADENWQKPCPTKGCKGVLHCGQATHERTYGNRRFAGMGALSIRQGWHPSEAKRAAQLMPKTGHCINTTTGDVTFPDSRTEQAYRKELAKIVPDSAKSLKDLGIKP